LEDLPGERGLESPLPACRCGSRCPIAALIGQLCLVRGEPVAQLMGADLPSQAQGRCAYMVNGLPVTMGAGMSLANTERIRVLTITITAPQQVHRIGARFLNQAVA
jgi:hypothetical protein